MRRGSSFSESKYLKGISDSLDQEMERRGFATDMGLMKGMVRQLRVDAPRVVICRQQVRLLVRRLGVIYETLNRLPNATPSPQLFSVFQCSLFLVSKLCPSEGSPPLWRQMLEERFICTTLFGGIRSRIRQVWRLQPTDQWEREDKEAAASDEGDALALLLRLAQEKGEDPQEEQVYGSSPDQVGLQVAPESLKHVMRRLDGVSSWKLLFNEHIVLRRAPLPRGAMASRRFEVFLGALLHKAPTIVLDGIPPNFLNVQRNVVVKVLAADSPCMTSLTMECFVIDVATRMRWVHPHLVEVFGGFAERLIRKSDYVVPSPEGLEGSAVPAVPEVPPPACSVEEGEIAEPYLGIVVEEIPTSLVIGGAEERNLVGSASSFPPSWCCTNRLFSTLDELSHPLSAREAVEIVSQASDALQYCLLDEGDVPAVLRRAWACLAPSNVYVREVPAEAASGSSHLTDLVRSLTDRFEVRIFPRLFAEGHPLSRWDPPTAHPSPETYTLSLLLLYLVEGAKPYANCKSHADIERSIADFNEPPLPRPETLLLPSTSPQDIGSCFTSAVPALAATMRKSLLWGTSFAGELGAASNGPTLFVFRQLLRDALTVFRTQSEHEPSFHTFGAINDLGSDERRRNEGHDEYGMAGAVVSSATAEPSMVGAA